MDCSLPGPSIHGIFQARVMEWGAIAFSNQLSQGLSFQEFRGFKRGFIAFQHLPGFSLLLLSLTSEQRQFFLPQTLDNSIWQANILDLTCDEIYYWSPYLFFPCSVIVKYLSAKIIIPGNNFLTCASRFNCMTVTLAQVLYVELMCTISGYFP